jgi:copper chaperone CopZ
MTTQTFELTGLHCGKCVSKVTQALSPFAQEVQVTLEPMQARLIAPRAEASLSAIQAALAQVGSYGISAEKNVLNQAIAGINTAVSATENIATIVNPTSWLRTYYPLLLILTFILGGSLLIQLGQHSGHGMGVEAISSHETMRYFMAGFFIVFAFFKLLDIQAFADAYAGYDLLAARWRSWGLIYPFVELGLGIAYLANIAPTATAWVTIFVMGFSAIGVIQAVLDKRRIRCACLGSVFNLPMSTVTIVEDVGMVLMAVWMLAFTATH